MATSIADKLRIREGFTLLTLNAPADFKKGLGKLPAGVNTTAAAKDYDQIHWFVLNKAALEKNLSKIRKLVKDDMLCWVYYPKGSSSLQTDLNRDKGWEELLKHKEYHWISLISFDDTWSTFAFRLKNEADRKKDATPRVREIFDYVDPVSKTVRLPDDLSLAFKAKPKLEAVFNTLSFTNRKEYIEWIVTAKREETRADRVRGTLERLQKGWKNPRNM